MTQRAFEIIQNVLITAIAVVLALAVWTVFVRVIQSPDPAVIAEKQSERAADAAAAADEQSGFPGDAGAEPGDAAGSAEAPLAAPGNGECREEPPETGSGTILRVFYTCGTSAVPNPFFFVYRVVPSTNLVLTATMEEMVRGPDARERSLGFLSFFSAATTGALADVSLNAGRATIEFRGLETIPNISTATGSEFFLANVNANVFQFETIDAVEYRLNGSCAEFWNLLQRDCQLVTRGEWERQLAIWQTDA